MPCGMLKLILKEMRPRQWPKNFFVFLPLIFTVSQYWRPFTPTMWVFFGLTLGAFFVFCLASGFVYFVNDLVDVEKDRAHPRKRTRPIASGALPENSARVTAVVLLLLTLASAVALDAFSQTFPYPAGEPIFALPYAFTVVTVVYLLLQIAYSFYLKHIVIIDVFCIAGGFVLRAVAGAAIIQVPVSPWLYVLTTLLSLFIGFAKRRNEIVILEDNAKNHRAILEEYSPQLLDQMIAITMACTAIAYFLYTFTAENLPKNHAMMLTIPFALYGIFRYMYLIYIKNEGGSPEEALLRDRPLLIDALLWGATVVIILYVFGGAN
ncbi:MAG: decaprenyl-phosphate phosphoribosyltransferase [Chloroflexi bacterium]|nr:MAG: decaprenyl-phosphate phosphoribosyltransferase [Chloroflexota bacterium]